MRVAPLVLWRRPSDLRGKAEAVHHGCSFSSASCLVVLDRHVRIAWVLSPHPDPLPQGEGDTGGCATSSVDRASSEAAISAGLVSSRGSAASCGSCRSYDGCSRLWAMGELTERPYIGRSVAVNQQGRDGVLVLCSEARGGCGRSRTGNVNERHSPWSKAENVGRAVRGDSPRRTEGEQSLTHLSRYTSFTNCVSSSGWGLVVVASTPHPETRAPHSESLTRDP